MSTITDSLDARIGAQIRIEREHRKWSLTDLAQHSTAIGKGDLQPADLMINPDTGSRGHVVLFVGWVDASMTSYYGYEQSGDGGTHYRKIPYPYFGTFSMTPYRFRR